MDQKPGCMPTRIRPSEADGKQSLVDHAASKAWEARLAHGIDVLPGLTMDALAAVLEDRRFVRYPVRIVYDADALEVGEFAFVEAVKPGVPAEGFVLFVHPHFERDEEMLPMLVAYHLVCVNYGEIAGPEAAEAFGAALMGMEVEEYYRELCKVSDFLERQQS